MLESLQTMTNEELAPFVGKRVQVYHESGRTFTGYLRPSLADGDRAFSGAWAPVYQVDRAASHPNVDLDHYTIDDPAAIDRIFVIDPDEEGR